MPSVCLYFEVHQPLRLRRFSYFDKADGGDYFDERRNRQHISRLAERCYLPSNELLLRLIDRFQGKFRVAFSLSGVLVEQLREYAPQALASFQQLARTGCVELLGETYYHSLASLFDEHEFVQQVQLHDRLMRDTFGVAPKAFRNTELLYSDRMGQLVASMGYRAMLTGIGHYQLGWKSPNSLYQARGNNMMLLVKNYQLSDDIAFRFSRQDWKGFPLTADKFAGWLHDMGESAEVVNLFMDYETFGEHHWDTSGIFEFLDHFPAEVLRDPSWSFRTPSELAEHGMPAGELPCPQITSWGGVGSDLSRWLGSSLQANALNELYRLAPLLRKAGNSGLLDAWRKLQSSDHFYYMIASTPDSRASFSPYDNPSEAFINFMNVVRSFEQSLEAANPERASATLIPSLDTDIFEHALSRRVPLKPKESKPAVH